jgi:hypothetical protein
MAMHEFRSKAVASTGPVASASGSTAGRLVIADLLREHFGHDIDTPDRLSITEREFPFRVRADLQRSVEQMLSTESGADVRRFCGVRKAYAFQGVDFSDLIVHDERQPVVAVPPQYEEVEIGEIQPVRCLKDGLWLIESRGIRYAVLLGAGGLRHVPMPTAMRMQIATTNDAAGAQIAVDFFRTLEQAVNECRSYRGKILSLEQEHAYTGRSTGIKVHKLHTVQRDQVILPSATLELLDRNVLRFVEHRERLRAFGQATKKGLLFYGPPGTGKSHTIHYLAGVLKGHTTLLITAAQVGLLGEYMALARLLQPSVVVIEDVDLIARDREHMQGPCEEAMLNRLLNEMDGLKENGDILFILTTNRPESLEAALTSRPGRIDQAIEFPLPDEAGREKLVRLYSSGRIGSDEIVAEIVRRTDKVSAAFIKELMRRATQFHIERNGSGALELIDVSQAIDEMLFSGGSLNVKLLGGNVELSNQGAAE